jgi:hypothetical protein
MSTPVKQVPSVPGRKCLAVQLIQCYEQDCNFLSSIVLTAQQDASASEKFNYIKKNGSWNSTDDLGTHSDHRINFYIKETFSVHN